MCSSWTVGGGGSVHACLCVSLRGKIFGAYTPHINPLIGSFIVCVSPRWHRLRPASLNWLPVKVMGSKVHQRDTGHITRPVLIGL